jgi:cysteine-rich repeat protein
MNTPNTLTRSLTGVPLLLVAGLLVFAWGLTANTAYAIHACGDGTLDYDEVCDDGNLIDGDGCNSICQLEANSCIDDVTGVTNNCTANDVRVALIINRGGDVFCPSGGTVDVELIAELEATSAERWDIGMFVALDEGTARTGTCYQDFLDGVDPPLEPTQSTDSKALRYSTASRIFSRPAKRAAPRMVKTSCP